MVKSPIRVFVRTRPVLNASSKSLFIDDEEGCVNLNLPRNEARGHINHQLENWNFRYDGILTNVSQDTVFELTTKDIIKSALEGYSGTIFCYGQTGAGKTFTMSGSNSIYQKRGIIPRALTFLFEEIEARPHEQFDVKISYLEIYNETMVDLLSDSQDTHITINEGGKAGVVIKGLSQIPCTKEDEGLSLLFQGEINKTMAQHKLNQNSSRSHSIFTIYIQSKSKVGSSDKIMYSKINLVDLAGSERTKKTGSGGQALIEANHINKSLSFLEQVVIALCEKQRDHVPYRQSKLTYLLKDSLGGNCKTVMIANIWPEASNIEETISTLKFAARMKNVSNEATANIWIDGGSPRKKFEPRQTFGFFENEEPLTSEERYEQYLIAQKYFNGELDDIEVKSARQTKELFFHFRSMYRTLYDATKDFFHLIPDEKRKELGIKATLKNHKTLQVEQSQGREHYGSSQSQLSQENSNSRKKGPEFRNEEYDSKTNFSQSYESNYSRKKEVRREDLEAKMRDFLSKAQSEKEDRLNQKSITFTAEKSEEEGEIDRKLIKGIAGIIRRRSSKGRIQVNKNLLKEPIRKLKFENDFEHESSFENDLFRKEPEDNDDELDIREIKHRFKLRAGMINELKTNTLLTDQNIRKIRSIVANTIEENSQAERCLSLQGSYHEQYLRRGFYDDERY